MSLQGLNRSLAKSAAEFGWTEFGLKWLILLFVKLFDFCQKQFLAHNFGCTYSSKSIKGSKDADHSLVSKTFLSQKNGSLC